MHQRKIPSSGESLPVIGIGTWQQFDVNLPGTAENDLTKVLQTMHAGGGTVIDSSPMYGRAETAVGYITQRTGVAADFFYATKIWTHGAESGYQQVMDSLKKMRVNQLDLVQVHNMQDWKTHLKTLNKLKEDGVIRYTGITHYTASAHERLEEIIKTEKIDFVQFNYSMGIRNAEKTLLPLCLDHGVAVIINEPFEKGRLFFKIRNNPLPPWAPDFGLHNWTDYFLKYIISHPAVTCVIPGTSDPHHMEENVRAGKGILPDAKARKMMVEYLMD